jgi:hypothetical protein
MDDVAGHRIVELDGVARAVESSRAVEGTTEHTG